MPGLLTGRVAVVTAAGSGIGRATALRMAAEGAFVVVNDIVPERADETVSLLVAAGGAGEVRSGDVTDSAFVDAMVDDAVAAHGRLDVLHSNAGFGMAHGLLATIDDAGWHANVALNLDAMFYCVRAGLRVMTPKGTGSIVCTSSAAGLGAVPESGPYGAAKAAILQLVRSAAVEYGGTGVRVNAVIPGAVLTPAFRWWIGTDERLAAYERQIPVGRMARPEDIAAAVVWLASDESAYVTGIGLVVDGGASAALNQPRID